MGAGRMKARLIAYRYKRSWIFCDQVRDRIGLDLNDTASGSGALANASVSHG
jgi:hypothetical protein